MKKGYIITQQEIYRERFDAEANNLEINIEDVGDFLRYTFFILELAFKTGIIDQKRRDEISLMLLDCFESQTRSEDILVTNKMYIFAAWLMQYSKWEAWLKLEKITDFKSVLEIYEEAEHWYFEVLRDMKLWHDLAGKCIEKIDNSNLKAEYSRMANLLNKMERYAVNPGFSFKSEHISKTQTSIIYCFINDNQGNVIEVLKNSFYKFAMELQIFVKLNGKQFVEFCNSDYSEAENTKTLAELELNENFETKIKAVKFEKEKALDAAVLFNFKYDNMTEEEQAAVSSEILDANDEVAIKSKYDSMILQIQLEQSEAEKNLENMFSMINQLEGSLLLQDIPSLSSMLQELALVSLFKRGIINYPDSRIKKGMILSKLHTSFAIQEFLNYAEDNPLTENECKFLKISLEEKQNSEFDKELEEIKVFTKEIENLTFFELVEFAKKCGLCE